MKPPLNRIKASPAKQPAFEARNESSTREPANNRKLQRVWDCMRAWDPNSAGFTSLEIAHESGAIPRYVSAYVKALHEAGYLRRVFHSNSPHRASTYQLSGAYRGEIAPQMAGGSGGGGGLGKGWNRVEAKGKRK